MSDFLMHNYARLPVSFTRGEGVYLFDCKNRRYLDGLAGIAVCGLGHAHPELADTLAQQAHALWHTSNIFEIPAQAQAAEKLCQVSGMDRAYFCNSGTEANEAALKLTRLHARKRNIENPVVLTFHGGFHGRTFGAMAATANPKIRAGFEPQLADFQYLPFNDLSAVAAYAKNPNVVAVMLECFQGEGGVHPIDPAFLRGVRQLCDERHWLLICDEVQIGMMRSGRWFGYQQSEILPDIVTLAKGLGNGIPVGATLARGETAEYIQPGMHGSTFGGSPLVMCVVNKVLEIYSREGFSEHVRDVSNSLLGDLQQRIAPLACVEEIRARGLMVGIELVAPVPDLVSTLLQAGLIANVTAEKVVRLLPPLIINETQAREMVDILLQVLGEC